MNAAPWPIDPDGDMVPVLEASVEAAKMRHPSASPNPPGVMLVATDRCDNCSAAAAYRVSRISADDPHDVPAMVLDFCAHHWKKHFPKMVDQGWVVVGGNPEFMKDTP